MTDSTHVLVRGITGFFFMFILARLMGKRQITQITYFDYIVGITIGSIAAELTFSTYIRMSNFIIGMTIWAVIPIIISKLEIKSLTFRTLMEGKSTVIIENGQILEENLKKESVTVDELMILLRKKDVFTLADVESAILEKNGELSIMKKSELEALTPKDIGLTMEKQKAPSIVILDGNVMEKNLVDYGYTKEWLLGEIMKQGAKTYADVFLAQIDSMGTVFVDLYHDTLKMPQMKEKLLVAANIKQLQASLINFSLQSQNKDAKEMYQGYATQMDKLVSEMAVYLKE
ncbi:MAG: DUF421 domain-containing protein [Firmicutes bacterium]|nr:DUF421 domain-containing protein [Bacillota bacterium]